MSTAFRFSVDQFERMIEQGVLDDSRDRRIELMYGELREMTPPGPKHEDVVDLLTRWSTQNTDPSKTRVRVQNSVGIPELDSVPYPDISWVREKSYRTARPVPAEVLLVIEVSDTTLRYDRGEKAELYARAGIQDYWIVDLQHWCVEVYRSPHPSGYREKKTYDSGDSIALLALPDVALPVSLLFGEPSGSNEVS
jgi:Uma2 family endonuclease